MSNSTPPPAKWPWSVLGLERMPPEVADVRRAYAKALKKIDLSTDIEGFAALRSAYENALTVREGRTATAEAKRARKAKAAEKARTGADPVPPPPAPQAVADALSAEERDLDLLQNIATETQRKEEALAALLHMVTTPNLLQSFEQRVLMALESPFMADPAHKARLRFIIARYIQTAAHNLTDEHQALPPEFTRSLMKRLDQEFGWVSDYAAFRDDFWTNNSLLDLMLDRHGGGIANKDQNADVPKSLWGKVWHRATKNATLLAFGLVGLFWLLSVLSSSNPDNPILSNLLLGYMLAFGVAVALVPIIFVFNIFTQFFHRYTAGLATGIFLLCLGLMIAGFAPEGVPELAIFIGLVLVLRLVAYALKYKRGAQLEALLRRMANGLMVWRT